MAVIGRMKTLPTTLHKWLVLLIAILSLSQGCLATFSLEPTVASGRLWRRHGSTYLPVERSGWHYNKQLYLCNQLNQGPPSSIDSTPHRIRRSSEFTSTSSMSYSVSNYFRMVCADTACGSATLTVAPSVGTENQVEMLCYKTPLSVRLMTAEGVTNTSYGYVQLYRNQLHQPLCKQGFGRHEASVTCKQLGFVGGEVLDVATEADMYNITDLADPPFGLNAPVRGFACSGAEKSLSMCPHSGVAGWSSTRCNDIAAVRCYTTEDGDAVAQTAGASAPASTATAGPTTATAAGGGFSLYPSASSGILWRSLDSDSARFYPVVDSSWNFNVAQGVCRGLNLGAPSYFQSNIGASRYILSAVDQESGSTTYSNGQYVSTTGATLMPVGRPSNAKQLRLSCFDHALPIRLRTGSGDTHRHYGVVEIRLSDAYGYVCGASWTDASASVACRELGFTAGTALPQEDFAAHNLTEMIAFTKQGVVGGIMCAGTEAHLSECPHHGALSWQTTRCSTLAAVICTGTGVLPDGHDPLAITAGTVQTSPTASPSDPMISQGPDQGNETGAGHQPTPAVSTSVDMVYIIVIVILAAVLALFIAVIIIRARKRRARKAMLANNATDGRAATSYASYRMRPVPPSPARDIDSPLDRTTTSEPTPYSQYVDDGRYMPLPGAAAMVTVDTSSHNQGLGDRHRHRELSAKESMMEDAEAKEDARGGYATLPYTAPTATVTTFGAHGRVDVKPSTVPTTSPTKTPTKTPTKSPAKAAAEATPVSSPGAVSKASSVPTPDDVREHSC